MSGFALAQGGVFLLWCAYHRAPWPRRTRRGIKGARAARSKSGQVTHLPPSSKLALVFEVEVGTLRTDGFTIFSASASAESSPYCGTRAGLIFLHPPICVGDNDFLWFILWTFPLCSWKKNLCRVTIHNSTPEMELFYKVFGICLPNFTKTSTKQHSE